MMLYYFWPLLTGLLFFFFFFPPQLWVMCCSSSGGFQSRCAWIEGYWISAVFTQVLQWDGSALSWKLRDWETEENRRKALEQHWADPTSNMTHIDNIDPFRPFQTAIDEPSLKTVQTHQHKGVCDVRACVRVCRGCYCFFQQKKILKGRIEMKSVRIDWRSSEISRLMVIFHFKPILSCQLLGLDIFFFLFAFSSVASEKDNETPKFSKKYFQKKKTELMWWPFTSFWFSSNAQVNLAGSNNVNKYGWWDDQNIPPGLILENKYIIKYHLPWY